MSISIGWKPRRIGCFLALETKTKNVFADLINAKTEALMRFYDLKVVRAAKQKAANIKRVLKKEFE